ncbi:EamA family transporter RarD [Brachyspira alvinipulli]|uniref:EamA family transporter RarD n=1 Tax=Brachyspira alvinipulli TaxID=84379 RepID=UPI003004060C
MMKTGVSIFAAAIVQIIWGLLPIYWKTIDNFNASFILSMRIITTLIFTFIIILQNGSIKKLYRGKKELIAILFAGLFIGLNWYFYIYAVNSNRVLESGLAYYISPILSILIGIIFFKEKKNALEYTAIVLMIIGILYQTYAIGYPPVLSLIMASTFSIYTALKKITSYSAWESLFLESLSILIPALFLFKIYYPAQPQPINTWIILLMIGFVTGLPLYLFSLVVKNIPISTLGCLQFICPILETILGALIYKEELPISKIITFIIIISAASLYAFSLIKNAKKSN